MASVEPSASAAADSAASGPGAKGSARRRGRVGRQPAGIASAADTLDLPPGSSLVRVENLDGIILLPATLTGVSGRDTSGSLVLDTGAGSLALDFNLARTLGAVDAESLASAVEIAPRPLAGLRIGRREIGPVTPLLTVNMSPVRGVTDRRPLGLLGQAPLEAGGMALDLDSRYLALVPAVDSAAGGADPLAASRARFGRVLSPRARAIPFRLAGDNKILVRARIVPPSRSHATQPLGRSDSLSLILDTGATKCVLFEDVLAGLLPDVAQWPALRGLWAPTLFGAAPARVVVVPELAVGPDSGAVVRPRVDVLLTGGAMARALERAIGEPVQGLLGYSFLRHYRIAIDYPHRLLWLDSRARAEEERPFEYSQPGLQLERLGELVVVAGVVEGSPAEQAGIGEGDEIVRIESHPASRTSVLELARALEGPPGTSVLIEVRHGKQDRTLSVARRWLL